MAIPLYLAKTAAEFAIEAAQPPYLAWMACHFSPYSTGITNLPSDLPPDSMLILNDRTPIQGHNPKQILSMLNELVGRLHCSGILLDFQRPDCDEAKGIIDALLTLPHPVCVSHVYAQNLNCPVFLPPIPLNLPPEEYLTPWQGREIWMEVSLESLCISVTERGCSQSPWHAEGVFPFKDEKLHCRYRTELQPDTVRFYLTRSGEDLRALLDTAALYGVTKAVGLWQELK